MPKGMNQYDEKERRKARRSNRESKDIWKRKPKEEVEND